MHVNNQQAGADEELVMSIKNAQSCHYYGHKQTREYLLWLLLLLFFWSEGGIHWWELENDRQPATFRSILSPFPSQLWLLIEMNRLIDDFLRLKIASCSIVLLKAHRKKTYTCRLFHIFIERMHSMHAVNTQQVISELDYKRLWPIRHLHSCTAITTRL